MIRVLLVEDHQLFREALVRILADDREIEIAGEVADGLAATQAVAELKPDVVLMDVGLPKMDGLEATRRLMQRPSPPRVLMLTVSEKEDHLFAAVRAGARGYLLKDASAGELLEAIKRVYAGEAIVSPTMAAKLLEAFASLSPVPDVPEGGDDLTPRETEVLRHIARGLSNKEVAAELAISPHTVKAHLRRALDKLHLRSRTEAAVWATRRGI